MLIDAPKCRIVNGEPAVAERLINELWSEYQLITVNISAMENKPWITAILVHHSEIPRTQSHITVPMPGFRQ
jgi:hypothetical protein